MVCAVVLNADEGTPDDGANIPDPAQPYRPRLEEERNARLQHTNNRRIWKEVGCSSCVALSEMGLAL
eukprot:scaffold132447_cov33-Tisochrysis_lutea.AAC.5